MSGGTVAGTAVYGQTLIQGPADVVNSGGLSPYGTRGQGGNAWELIETAYSGVNDDGAANRGLRGGSWGSDESALRASVRAGYPVNLGFNIIGFRVAAVPEPSEWPVVVMAMAGACLWIRRKSTR